MGKILYDTDKLAQMLDDKYKAGYMAGALSEGKTTQGGCALCRDALRSIHDIRKAADELAFHIETTQRKQRIRDNEQN